MRASRLAAAAAICAAAVAVLLLAAWRGRARLRHLAVPVAVDPSSPAAPGAELGELGGCEVRELARVPGRVTALLQAGDELWIGTFDAGLFRLAEGELAPVAGLAGRQRFVNALAAHDGLVWAATQGGAVAWDGERRALTLLAGEGVSALARAGRSLFAGTARGLFRLSAGGDAEPVEAAGPSGEPLRVTALAAGPALLWIGTASGAYSLPLASAEAPLLARTARWHPLVFGDPPAETNVVTALAPLPGGALAGTDDGGVVRLGDGGGVAALRLADPRANEVNPGSADAAADGAAVVGTQGGGVLLVRPVGTGMAAVRLAETARLEIAALRVRGEAILTGAADGAVRELRCGARSAHGALERVPEPVLAEEQLAAHE